MAGLLKPKFAAAPIAALNEADSKRALTKLERELEMELLECLKPFVGERRWVRAEVHLRIEDRPQDGSFPASVIHGSQR
jgi:hypothetical protein